VGPRHESIAAKLTLEFTFVNISLYSFVSNFNKNRKKAVGGTPLLFHKKRSTGRSVGYTVRENATVEERLGRRFLLVIVTG
jgi:hypothetical protein